MSVGAPDDVDRTRDMLRSREAPPHPSGERSGIHPHSHAVPTSDQCAGERTFCRIENADHTMSSREERGAPVFVLDVCHVPITADRHPARD
ncbi:hypothetical protein GCM10010458_03510 [Microbacterium luteolum]